MPEFGNGQKYVANTPDIEAYIVDSNATLRAGKCSLCEAATSITYGAVVKLVMLVTILIDILPVDKSASIALFAFGFRSGNFDGFAQRNRAYYVGKSVDLQNR